MITKKNLEGLLNDLNFVKRGSSYIKHYADLSCDMKADFKNEKLVFPLQIEGRERNVGFDKAENFVVFECVDRLLTIGYRPEHPIEMQMIKLRI